MSELSPCPWCDSTDVKVIGRIALGYAIVCNVCAAKGPSHTHKLEAIELWNQRKGGPVNDNWPA